MRLLDPAELPLEDFVDASLATLRRERRCLLGPDEFLLLCIFRRCVLLLLMIQDVVRVGQDGIEL